MKIYGACHCGEITFTAEIDPSRVMVCHCTDCQVQSGGAFRMVVLAPIEGFELHGQPSSYVKVAKGQPPGPDVLPHVRNPALRLRAREPHFGQHPAGVRRAAARFDARSADMEAVRAAVVARVAGLPGSSQQQSLLPPSGR